LLRITEENTFSVGIDFQNLLYNNNNNLLIFQVQQLRLMRRPELWRMNQRRRRWRLILLCHSVSPNFKPSVPNCNLHFPHEF
jgi:hypothetical protein